MKSPSFRLRNLPLVPSNKGAKVSDIARPERRRAKRAASKERVSLLVERGELVQRMPCLILDTSPGGFRIDASARLKRGDIVELVWEQNSTCYQVIWAAELGSQLQGQAGLRRVARSSQ